MLANTAPRTTPQTFDAAGALARGLGLLAAFRPGDDWLGNAELSRRTGLCRATVSRLCASLVQGGCLRRNAKGQFAPGLQWLVLAGSALGGVPVRRLAGPPLATLAQAFGGVACVVTLQHHQVTLVDQVQHRTAHAAAPGDWPQPLADTAAGPALLSLLDPAQARALLAQPEAGAAHPLAQARLLQRLADCRRQGYCLAGAAMAGGASIALPLVLLPARPPAGRSRPQPASLPLALHCTAPAARARFAEQPGKAGPEWPFCPDLLRRALNLAAGLRAALLDACA